MKINKRRSIKKLCFISSKSVLIFHLFVQFFFSTAFLIRKNASAHLAIIFKLYKEKSRNKLAIVNNLI